MLIDIDGRVLCVPPEIEAKIAEQLYVMLLGMHARLDKPKRLLLKPLARHMLSELEQELNKLGKDGRRIRPKDGRDPALHLAGLHLATYMECMKDAILLIDTSGEGTDTVTAFNLSIRNPGQAGGQISLSGDLGLRQNNRGQVPGPGADDAVPNEPPLHL